jgi:plasmid stabilization system protein ParE
MNEIRLTDGAEMDLEETIDWYREEDPNAAARFIIALEATYRAILESPTRYPKLPGGCRYRIVEKHPISVIYRIVAGEIEVVAIAHAKRKPGYWRRRNGRS